MNKAELKAMIKGRKQVYVLFYCNDNGNITIFSGGKFFVPEGAEHQGNIICNCTGEPIPDEEVISIYESQKKHYEKDNGRGYDRKPQKEW